MRKNSKIILAAGILGLMLTASSYAQVKAKEEAKPETGKDIALNVRKGNCLACHLMRASLMRLFSAIRFGMQAKQPQRLQCLRLASTRFFRIKRLTRLLNLFTVFNLVDMKEIA
jgi:hypothetical protein